MTNEPLEFQDSATEIDTPAEISELVLMHSRDENGASINGQIRSTLPLNLRPFVRRAEVTM